MGGVVPNVAPPQVTVGATYWARMRTAEQAVTQAIQQQLTGIDNLRSADSSPSGRVSINLTSRPAPTRHAQVQVQNSSRWPRRGCLRGGAQVVVARPTAAS